jgi:ParB-like chromosome segregation protein Spo0J
MAFERESRRISIADIQPLRLVGDAVTGSVKFAQIVASIREVGIIEPLVVARDRADGGKFLLLDGHLRLEVLKNMGETEVNCLISTDDEAFTYNRRLNRLAIIQEHRMILKAVSRGVPEGRIAKTLNVNVGTLKQKLHLLDGICPEAADLLKDRHVAHNTFGVLKRMASVRQIEAAELMVAMNKYSISYARSLLAATPQSLLADSYKSKVIKGLTKDQITLMERESSNLEREFRMAEQSYGADHLDLVLVRGYLGSLLSNSRVTRYLRQRQPEILEQFQKIAEAETIAA